MDLWIVDDDCLAIVVRFKLLNVLYNIIDINWSPLNLELALVDTEYLCKVLSLK